MLYVIQVLAAIQIGLAVGVLLGPKHPARLGSSVLAIILALAAIFTGSWIYLAVATALFLLTMGLRHSRPIVGG
ncbi:MAG TPA: hypothetical protein VKZ70_15015 [Burkholderiaceae bacterium]|nr:hypothetical protein [Burkholderiaceae bacterium]